MMALIIIIPLAVLIGYRIGQQNTWVWWHGPVAAVIVIPLAYLIGFNATLSVIAPLCLVGGFLASRI